MRQSSHSIQAVHNYSQFALYFSAINKNFVYNYTTIAFMGYTPKTSNFKTYSYYLSMENNIGHGVTFHPKGLIYIGKNARGRGNFIRKTTATHHFSRTVKLPDLYGSAT